MSEAPPPPLVWYRPSIRREVWKAAFKAMPLQISGAVVIGLLRIYDVDFGSPWMMAYAVGLVLVASSPLYLIVRLTQLVGRERTLSIHRDGLRWLVGTEAPAFCAWRDVGEPIIGEALVIPTAGEPWLLPRSFDGISDEDLVRQILDLRQKALLGLPVRPRSPLERA